METESVNEVCTDLYQQVTIFPAYNESRKSKLMLSAIYIATSNFLKRCHNDMMNRARLSPNIQLNSGSHHTMYTVRTAMATEPI
jgi:hypothetical protein